MKKLHDKIFKFLDWQFDTDSYQLLLNYEIETIGLVTEILTFPKFDKDISSSEFIAACNMVHLMCGVSYYKSGLAKEVVFNNKPSKLMAKFIEKTWKHGLAELAFENDISLDLKGVSTLKSFDFKEARRPNPKDLRVLTPLKSLVALGGGKDSLVTIEELKQQGKDINLFMVGNSQLIKEVAEFIDLPLIQVQRKIDPKLIQYNKTDKGFNGHVPITAINSAIGILTALLFDCDEVVFSNEKSADSANTINNDGEEVNHQYSKSYEFEKDLSKILSSEITRNIRYYSQQRKFSELEILEKFAKYPQYFPVFSSCNRNFHIDGSKNKNSKWCNNCPKCRFVFLGLAPFVDKQQLMEVFNHNLLDDETQQTGFAELLGTQGFKPFECVGEIKESQEAFNRIKNKPEWQQDKLIIHFNNKINDYNPIDTIDSVNNLSVSSLSKKKVALWGFGVESKATAKYLTKHHVPFTVLCTSTEVDDRYECVTKQVDKELLDAFDVVIKSPGISPYSDLVKNCRCQFTSSTALWFANEKRSKVIAVTGTKGKSTIVSLLAHVLKQCGKTVNLVGNIGKPLISSSSNYDYIVLESSSFQIYDGNIQTEIALINNLFTEHIDWHKNEKNYFNDKIKILNNADVKIINAQNKTLNKLVKQKDLLFFNNADGYHVNNEILFFNNDEVLRLTQINLIGVHNLENIAAVLTICQELNIPAIDCVEAVKNFKPLAHRLQNLGKIGTHFAVNDSIATTPVATLAAMQTFDLEKTTLIVGGFDRGHDWSDFAQELNDNPANFLILCGQTGAIINKYLHLIKSHINYKYCVTLSEAITTAQKQTVTGGTILLSPGAPSFDEFSSYIQRGEFFEEQLKKLIN